MTDRPFQNDSSPAERHRVLFRDTTRQPTTYRDVARVDETLDSTADRRARAEVGGDPATLYPRQPFSPWTNTSNSEPPTGIAIDAQESEVTGDLVDAIRDLANDLIRAADDWEGEEF
jgi:hypothetical protein